METEGCYSLTKKSGKCVLQNRKSSDGCFSNIKYCKQDSQNYHKLCDRYWNLSDADITKMSEEKVKYAIEDLDVCLYMRQRHMDTCVHPECRDREHEGAIIKLKTKLEKIKAQKYNARLNEATEKLLKKKTLSDSEIDKIIQRSLDRDVEEKMEYTKSFNLPALPLYAKASMNEMDFINETALRTGTIISFLEPIGVIEDHMISLKMKTGEEFIGMGLTQLDAARELSYILINKFGNPYYKSLFEMSLKYKYVPPPKGQKKSKKR